MWEEGIFAETLCLGLWASLQALSHALQGISLKWLPLDPILRIYLELMFTTQSSSSYPPYPTPGHHAQPDHSPHSPQFWLDPLVIFSPQPALREGGRANPLAWWWTLVKAVIVPGKYDWVVLIAFDLFHPMSLVIWDGNGISLSGLSVVCTEKGLHKHCWAEWRCRRCRWTVGTKDGFSICLLRKPSLPPLSTWSRSWSFPSGCSWLPYAKVQGLSCPAGGQLQDSQDCLVHLCPGAWHNTWPRVDPQ